MRRDRKNRMIRATGDLAAALLIGPVLFFVLFVLAVFDVISTVAAAVLFIAIYSLLALLFFVLKLRERSAREREQEGTSTLLLNLEQMLFEQSIPMVALDSEGMTIWANDSAALLFAEEETDERRRNGKRVKLVGRMFDEYSAQTFVSLITNQSPEFDVKIGHQFFEVGIHASSHSDKKIYFITYTNITRTVLWKSKFERNELCVAFVLIDNLAELTAQSGLGEYREMTTTVDRMLKDWTQSIDGIIEELTAGRYIMFFTNSEFQSMRDQKFSILEEISNAQKDSFSSPLTVSIGISTYGETLSDRESEALIALDNALQRGGAQVAIRSDTEGYEYFGGRSKTVQKRTSIRSRMMVGNLAGLISNAGNVIVMGHANPDFDAIGAALGLARLAETFDKEAIIVTNKHCDNFRIVTERLMQKGSDGYYQALFADSERGIDSMRSDTLVILADVNSIERCECPQIAQNAARIAVIDHHRIAAGAQGDAPDLNYNDPSASSACEMVSEMLEYSPVRVELDPEEANIMMSGIMLDTQNFVKSVGARTFSAALFLRNAGASNEVASTFFYEEMEDYTNQTKLAANVKLYKKKYIIAVNRVEGEAGARIAAAKAANKLLALRGVEACFVLACVGDNVMISARSKGKINVQLIIEKIGGGGHFDAAAAQLTDGSEATLAKLQRAIDDYENGEI